MNDILVFDGGPNDGSVGHVAIIIAIDTVNDTVTFIEQNMKVLTDRVFERDVWSDTLPLKYLDDEWFVEPGHYPFPIAGWSRPLNQSASPRSPR
ncbi:CHAP domain-containing protein [Candidatus Uhrbacteria bacterium]|nr:CHAP domain-containing protein [Candidatus Uhrbacteria bacterium]